MAIFRERLASIGLKLILDFVPNHVAVDHPWTTEQPQALVQGNGDELALDPDSFFEVEGQVFAFGRDPYFPAWTDTVQVNAFSEAYRQLSVETLRDIATQCDGVRCDMAMLLTNEIFAKTWSINRVGAVPAREYWDVVISTIQEEFSAFFFMAEVYWDMEYTLQQQGFSYCYDKRLYDRLVHENALSVNAHLHADLAYQEKLVRFIENHDEERALTVFSEEASRMAAILVATLPGAKLWHEGQFEGYRIKLPVQLGRRPNENPDTDLYGFYNKLIIEAHHPVYSQGAWALRQVVRAWPENATNDHLIAYTWRLDDTRRLIVVNYSEHQSQGRIPMHDFELGEHTWKLVDILDHNKVYHRDGGRLASDGLYVDLMPWSAHIFIINP